MNKPKKILTHSGIFHADEVFAVALVHCILGECPVVRTRDLTQEDIDDPEIWVLDVGKVYDESKHCFDHHQDSSLNATNRLILDYLYGEDCFQDPLYDELRPSFNEISSIDKGGYEEMNGFQVNSLIKALNNYSGTGFERALDIAKEYIGACMVSVNQADRSRQIWSEGKVESKGALRICTEFPIHWKRYNEEVFLIAPEVKAVGTEGNPDELEWKLHSINSNEWPIHHTAECKFLHVGRFLGIYNTKLEAICAALLSYNRKVMNG